MSNNNKKIGLFIGKFAPMHKGHLHIIKEALKSIDSVIICIGSSQEEMTSKIPFTYEQRYLLTLRSLMDEGLRDKCLITSCLDYNNDEDWVQDIQNTIDYYKVTHLVGFNKDSSSYYLNLFPNIKSIIAEDPYKTTFDKVVNSTDIREKLYQTPFSTWVYKTLWLSEVVTGNTLMMLLNYAEDDKFKEIAKKYTSVKKEVAKFKDYPYPDSLNICCADAVVYDPNNHKILLVTRKDNGSFSCAGGHLDNTETFLQCAIRELKEETGLDLVENDLDEATSTKVFDDPLRSIDSGFRRLTVAHLFLVDYNDFQDISGADDAGHAGWYNVDILNDNSISFHDDHRSIIKVMLNITE